MCCFKCKHTLKWQPHDLVVPCDGCGTIKCRKDFNEETLNLWISLADEPLYCKARSEQHKKNNEKNCDVKKNNVHNNSSSDMDIDIQ